MRVAWLLVIGTPFALVPPIAQADAATLTGQVCDINGFFIVGARAELQSEKDCKRFVRTVTDARGVYRFKDLQKGDYTLTLTSIGFRRVRIKSMHVSNGEQKSVPALVLEVEPTPFLDPLEYIRFLKSSSRGGNLGGAVVLYVGRPFDGGSPVVGAHVALVCPGNRLCGRTRTDSGGRFMFKRLAPGSYDIRVSHAGFYPETVSGFEVKGGRELIYKPLRLERCHLENCDPNLRPTRPLIIIE